MPGAWCPPGVGIEDACRASILLPITDDPDIREALAGAISACLQ